MTSSSRFSLASASDGGVLLDLELGALYRLNKTAALVWQCHLQGELPQSISKVLAEQFGIDFETATTDVARTLKLDLAQAIPSAIPSDFRYRHSEEVSQLWLKDRLVIEIAASGESVRACVEPDSPELFQCLRALSPKLLALQGAFVLHASAVQSSEQGLTAFVGESGAGKTTTARAFASTGMRLICEDKLILRQSQGRMIAVLDAEPALECRLADIHARMAGSPRRHWCDVRSLTMIADGASLPVERLLMIDRRRRDGTTIAAERMSETAALVAAFVNAFHGSSSRDEWQRQLTIASLLARTSPAYTTTVPLGLDELARAARDYSERIAS